MSALSIGIDFGTTNSAVAALSPSGELRLATFPNPLTEVLSDTAPTVLFYPSYENATFFGHEAVGRYLFTGFEGRFIQSIKTFLPSKSFTGTMIRGRALTIEDLVAVCLRRLLLRAEEALGLRMADAGSVVLGRPARYSLEPELDQLAESRLREAAARAGLARFELLIEPVAAALAYEADLEKDEVVLVVDLGGGTSDFTLMRVGPGHRASRDRRGSVLASRGVPIAGDRFDGEIVRTSLFGPLGEGSSYVPLTGRATVPHWIYQKLLQWNHVSFLKTKEMLEFLKRVAMTSDRPGAIGALVRLVEEDQGYLLHRAVERAKRALGESDAAPIADDEHALAVEATITRAEFEAATAPLVKTIHDTAMETLAAASIAPDGVDAVFMTGGTSLLPHVRAAFLSTFGPERLREGRTFTSVVDGLARGGLTSMG